MKKSTSIILTIVFTLICVSIGIPYTFAGYFGSIYCIDSVGGSDTSVGSSLSPWASVEPLKNIELKPGDKVLFKCGGTYNCELTLTCSGTKDAPIEISSYGNGAKPVLTTQNNTEVLRLFDCSYISLSNLEITAHNGGGIWIDTFKQTSYGISVDNVTFHDMQNYKVNARDNLSNGAATARACIMIKGLPARSRYAVNDLSVTNCEMYDCGNGISIWGSWCDLQTPWTAAEEDIDPVYNTGVLVKDCYFHDMDSEAIIVGMCDGALVTNCRAINCCQGVGRNDDGSIQYFCAALWFWGSENSTVQYCEVAGQKNFGDGMTVDFDSHTNNCTYQYIYSHDNTSFMCNNANYSGQHGNTVRYCLSVNDNAGRTRMSTSAGEYNFKFYNNTIINCNDFHMFDLHDSLVVNNIIIPKRGCVISYDLSKNAIWHNTFSNNCYYNCMTPLIDIFAKNDVPGFTGGSGTDAYTLAMGSPLIGTGYKINDGLTEDFFGNEITSCNIGCYGGSGTNASYEAENQYHKLGRIIRQIFDAIIHEVIVSIGNLKDK
jgi:hypothetical protein